ncbi:uncharacterized protein LOC130046469 [Ostrea edulis]|uniref:uncharacterized protein LOC130046469 n=1 Tax=Ostrea edulis TaxID=37623 RepID=UPI0024AFE694|nr:uncharacterized protein LOC130046469 [Ostrea edulis]
MCKHDPLTGEETGDKEFLIKGKALLESFHNHMLMYSSKRFAYTPPVYRARSLLAVLDYNENVERESLVNKDGTVRMQRTFNKKSGRWTVYAVKEKKKYTHVLSLFRIVLQRRIEDREGLQGRMVLEVGDPRRISKTIAPVLPSRTEEKKSRFKDS